MILYTYKERKIRVLNVGVISFFAEAQNEIFFSDDEYSLE